MPSSAAAREFRAHKRVLGTTVVCAALGSSGAWYYNQRDLLRAGQRRLRRPGEFRGPRRTPGHGDSARHRPALRPDRRPGRAPPGRPRRYPRPLGHRPRIGSLPRPVRRVLRAVDPGRSPRAGRGAHHVHPHRQRLLQRRPRQSRRYHPRRAQYRRVLPARPARLGDVGVGIPHRLPSARAAHPPRLAPGLAAAQGPHGRRTSPDGRPRGAVTGRGTRHDGRTRRRTTGPGACPAARLGRRGRLQVPGLSRHDDRLRRRLDRGYLGLRPSVAHHAEPRHERGGGRLPRLPRRYRRHRRTGRHRRPHGPLLPHRMAVGMFALTSARVALLLLPADPLAPVAAVALASRWAQRATWSPSWSPPTSACAPTTRCTRSPTPASPSAPTSAPTSPVPSTTPPAPSPPGRSSLSSCCWLQRRPCCSSRAAAWSNLGPTEAEHRRTGAAVQPS